MLSPGFALRRLRVVADAAVIPRNGEIVAIDKTGASILVTDRAEKALSTLVDMYDKARIMIGGDIELGDSVSLKPGIVITGASPDVSVTAPSGKPAFEYIQPSGQSSVEFRPVWIEDLTIKIPSSGGPHRAIRVDCSAGAGCARPIIKNVVIDGWNASGTYDNSSTNPHIAVEFVNAWNWLIENTNIRMPGILVKTQSYGYIVNSYINGGANGKATGIQVEKYGAWVRAIGLVAETNVRPVYKSVINYMNFVCDKCLFEGAFQSTDPVIQLDYSSGTYSTFLKLVSVEPAEIAMSINKTNKFDADAMLFSDRLVRGACLLSSYTVSAGSPTVSISNDRIVVDNSAGTDEAHVDIPCMKLNYMYTEIGGYLEGQGEARLIYGTLYYGLGIDANGNLYSYHYNNGTEETITIDDTGAGKYDVIGFIAFADTTKRVVYGVNGVYTSKIITHSVSLGFMAPDFIRLIVPAGQKLTYKPRVWIKA